MDRRTFIKTAVAGGAFLPTFATLEPPPKKKGESDIRVAVLGYGVAGRILGLDLAQMPGVRVCAVCDIWGLNRQNGSAFFKHFGHAVEVYEDYREMLDKEDRNIDAVIVSTPDWMHCEHVCACLARGKHVYCEAPIADTPAHAAEMCRAAKKARRHLQIGFQRRSDPRYQLAVKHIIPEMLGTMRLIQAHWGQTLQPFSAVKRPPKPEVLARYGYPNSEQYLNWRWFRKFGPGNAAMQLSLQADLFPWVWGVQPTSVTAVGSKDLFTPRREVLDTLMSQFEYKLPDGATCWASHRYSALSAAGGTRSEEFVGSRASLIFTLGFGDCVRFSGDGGAYEVAWKTFVERGWIEPSEADKHFGDGTTVANCMPTSRDTNYSYDYPLAVKCVGSTFKPHLQNFFAAIRGEATLNCPPEVAYATTVAVHGAIRSAERRETVFFKPEDFQVPEA